MFIHREMTAEEFLAFEAQHPDKRFDFIDGEMVEVSPTPPLWVAKIRSDTQSRAAQRRTMDAYLRHGAAMAVLILPGEAVEVFRPDQAVQVLTGEDVLEGGTVLPGFMLPVKRLLS
jgi:Uma2 family endonuclease